MREQELLLRSLQQCDFTLYELQLYLDTHPNCKRAMEQYRKHLEMKQKAEKMYVEKYGPIRPSQSNTTERWNWVDAPCRGKRRQIAMWTYEKKLQYPVNIKTPNPRLAKFIISQLGGPDGELAASLRYMHQRYGMKNNQVKGILTDIATEELAHVEMVSAILYQLTRDMTPEQILQDGYAEYFVDHTAGIYPQGASGMPFTAAYFQSKGDPITDLTEDLAAEQKARSTYENILRLCDDPDVREPIKFLRQREIVHFQRFGEAMRMVQDELNSKNFYCCNPAFDKGCGKQQKCSRK